MSKYRKKPVVIEAVQLTWSNWSEICDPVTVWVCQGPPRCDLEGDAAVRAQENGCQFCKRIVVDADGAEQTIEPGNA